MDTFFSRIWLSNISKEKDFKNVESVYNKYYMEIIFFYFLYQNRILKYCTVCLNSI